MQRQANDAQSNEVQPRTVDHRVDVEWQYSDSQDESSSNDKLRQGHERNSQFEGIQNAIYGPEDEENLIPQDVLEDHVDVEFESSNKRKVEQQDEDESKVFTFRSPELKSIKWVLPGTLQKIIPHPVAVLFVLLTFVYCLHVFGIFQEKTLVQEELRLTLTTFKNIIWTLRIPVFTFLGFCYLKMCLGDIPCSFQLSSRNLKTLKKEILRWCVVEVVFTVVLPVIAQLVEMIWLPTSAEKEPHQFGIKTAIMNTVCLALARLLALPALLNFIAEFHLLYYQVRQYEEDIQRWKQGLCKARNYFIDIQDKIKKAEKTFQLLLVLHLGILVLMFVPAVLSYVERFNNEGTVDKIILTQDPGRMSNPIILFDPMLVRDNESAAYQLVIKNKSGHGQMLRLVYQTDRQNNKTEEGRSQVAHVQTKKEPDKKARMRIILAALTFVGELLALYLPLVLLGKINHTLTNIPQTIRCGLKFDEQHESGYLIENIQVVKEMLKTVEHVDGFQIQGMRLTVVKALLIAVFAPLLTLLIHIMIRDVDISP